MNKKEDWLNFDIEDDTETIIFIQKLLKERDIEVEDDVIQYILDIIDEFYTKQELLDKEIDEAEMISYIKKIMSKDAVYQINEETLLAIVDGEYQYGLSTGIYTKD